MHLSEITYVGVTNPKAEVSWPLTCKLFMWHYLSVSWLIPNYLCDIYLYLSWLIPNYLCGIICLYHSLFQTTYVTYIIVSVMAYFKLLMWHYFSRSWLISNYLCDIICLVMVYFTLLIRLSWLIGDNSIIFAQSWPIADHTKIFGISAPIQL